jgi:hypothetical protein
LGGADFLFQYRPTAGFPPVTAAFGFELGSWRAWSGSLCSLSAEFIYFSIQIMKSKEMFALAPDTDLLHKRYGVVRVEKTIPDFGVVIQPITEIGKQILQRDSGAAFGTPLLEDNPRQIDFINAESVRAFNP